MPKVYFLFGLHNHQPVGNDPYIFREAFDLCYRPFLNVLKEFPNIKCNIHISGPLLDWIMENEKEYINTLKDLVGKKQVEMISGGYYEPILQTISDSDKLAQIRLMNEFIKKEFNYGPKGMWLTERIWEPYLAKIINEAGLGYTFLDDTHFRRAGAEGGELTGYYFTEESSRSIAVFPISKALRYKIPFSNPEEALAILKKFRKKEEDVLVTLFDDGEKFGLWPTTHFWVYEKNWLRDFFKLLSKNEKYIETITAGDALEKFSSNGLIYIPNSSYIEMDEWAMEPAKFRLYKEIKDLLKGHPEYNAIKHFISAGFFRNYFVKYPRINYMHKKMLALSRKIASAASIEKDADMFRALWKSQCNCGFWHGIFGGFYFGHIRASIYENLIEAERKFDERYDKRALSIETVDVDLDGASETVVKNEKILACFSDRGASIKELSLKEKNFNVVNTITRREEVYHSKIKGRARSEIVYDKYERLCFLDHVVGKNITLNDVRKQKKIKTISNEVYNLSFEEKENFVMLNYALKNGSFDLSKKIEIEGSAIKAEYDLEKTKLPEKMDFAVEFNFFIQSAKDATICFERESFNVEKKIAIKGINSLKVEDRFKRIKTTIEFDYANVFIVPVYSITSSMSGENHGIEKMFQEVSVLVVKKSKSNKFKIRLSFGDI